MDLAFVVVPIKVDLEIFAASVVDRDIVVFLEGVNEVVGVIARGVIYHEIVKNKGELDRSGGVFP